MTFYINPIENTPSKCYRQNAKKKKIGGVNMYKMLKSMAAFMLVVATVMARIPCWGTSYQPKAPKSIK